MTAFLSEDDGKTFPYSLLLDERSSVSYPDAMECDDGYIRIVYDRERGCFKSSLEAAYADAREIIVARITEQDILRGELSGKQSYLKRVVSKLDRLAPEDGNPFIDFSLGSAQMARQLMSENAEDVVEAIFDKYPTNCANAGSTDSKKIDMLITRFKESDCKDETVLTQIIEAIRKASHNKSADPIVDRIRGFIEQHLSEDIMLSQIAEKLGISVYYLAHVFKATTGTTVIEYRNELRLTRSKKMLIESDVSIARIAHEVGFESSSYFTELFTRSEKISPAKYRKLHRK
jgi:AraC-like DNA-binding protein